MNFLMYSKSGTKLLQVDCIRDTLKVVDMSGFRGILKRVVRKAIDNKVYDNGIINGYTVAAIDGTTFFGSYKKCCKNCLGTQVRGVKHFYHSGAVMSFIGDGVKWIIDFEMVNSINRFIQERWRRTKCSNTNAFKSCELAYQLYRCCWLWCSCFNSVWINSCIFLGVEAIIWVKNNNNNSLREVKARAYKSIPVVVCRNEKNIEKIDVYEQTFIMPGVEQVLRFVNLLLHIQTRKDLR